MLAGTLCTLAVVRLALGVAPQFTADGTCLATEQFGNVPLGVVLLHEAGDGHAVFRLEVAIRMRRFEHLLTLIDQVLHFTFESAMCMEFTNRERPLQS